MPEHEPKDPLRMNKPLTEDQIIEATVGERRPLNSTIHLAPYDQAWPLQYAQLEEQVHEALGDSVLLLEHVGSTAVPELSAKPIIDMVLAVADSSDESSYVPQLEQRGFLLRIREPKWYEHRVLKSQYVEANLHVFSAGCQEITRMLLFRDWLRTHPDDRVRYEEAKRELAKQTWKPPCSSREEPQTATIFPRLARA